MTEVEQKYIFRPMTLPMDRKKVRERRKERKQHNVIDQQIIDRPGDNFFKIIFQKDTYLWVVMNKNIKVDNPFTNNHLYDRMKQCYKNFDQQEYPICTDIEEFKRWTKDYQCKVALDENCLEYFDEIFEQKNCVIIRVVSDRNIQVVRKIRGSKHCGKIRGIDQNYNSILLEMKQDMQKVKIFKETQSIEKVRLPNFMKLRLKDKAELITYRNNIYCLAHLHRDKNDMEASKCRFIEQCEKMYHSTKDKQFMKYYLTYPFNDKEILKFYTQDSFFYRCLNNTLRMANKTEEFFIIGQPFNKMFHAIKQLYIEQFPYNETRKDLKLYRGADLSQTQSKYLESCIGNYIEIHGFVSTTFDLGIAKKFASERKHNKIIQILFDDITLKNGESINENDYGFVNLTEFSRFQQSEILFNPLNIFKVVGKQLREDGFEYYILKYGTIFNILNKEKPQQLQKQDRLAYYTYKELMAEKAHLQDFGQIFLKNNETQKCVDYYQAKILLARDQKNKSVEFQLILKQSQAQILNGQPAKALENMMKLLGQRKSIKKSSGGSVFLESIIFDKNQMIKQIEIRKRYSEAGHSLDMFDDAENQLIDANEAIQDSIKNGEWSYQIAYRQVQLKLQLANIKESILDYKEMVKLLRQAQILINQILNVIKMSDASIHNLKNLYLQKTLIYQLVAKNSMFLQGDSEINIDQLYNKFIETQNLLRSLVQPQGFEKSLIDIRKIQIERRREDFHKNKKDFMKDLVQSLVFLKVSSNQDSQIPKTYQMMAEIERQSKTITSTNNSISYFIKQYVTQSHYYGQNDPRSMKTVIEIAQCNRDLKDSQQSVDILRQQMKIIPFKNRPKHTIVTKMLYTMGLAYLDLGEFSYALKCFEKGLLILKQILSKNQFEKYHHKYKIELQLGRTYTSLLKYNEAEQNLTAYHQFIMKLYNGQHSNIANSLNYFAILYLKFKRLEQSKNKFEESAQMFKITSGQKALIVGKIKCNLGLIYSALQQKEKALKYIDEAHYLFNEIFAKEMESTQNFVHPQTYIVSYYYAEIHKNFKEYQLALDFYQKSKQASEKYKQVKKLYRQRREDSLMSQLDTQYNSSTKIMIQNKRDHHELICKVKILQCQVKMKNYGLTAELQKVIKELQRQSFHYNEIQNYKINDQSEKINESSSASQLKVLLNFCKKLQRFLEKKKAQLSNQKGAHPSHIQQIILESDNLNFQENLKPV